MCVRADGAAGAAAISGRGGCVIVQDPDEAVFPDMPLAAISVDHPDLVLPLGRIAETLRTAGVTKIDHLWTTHYHGDHVGALIELAKQFPVGHFYDHGKPHPNDRIERVLQLLHEDIARPPRLPEIGRRVGLSAFTLMRRFKRELGVRIGEYVLWRRMMSALPLVDGRATVADIAQLTGFYDQAHLTRTVRRMVSLAPSFINDMTQTRVHVCGGDIVRDCDP